MRLSQEAVVLLLIWLAVALVPRIGTLSATAWRGMPRIRCTPNFSPAAWT